MAIRTQLNVNIDPELLRLIKQNAIKSGITLTDYVNQVIKEYVSNEEINLTNGLIENRIERIENELSTITKEIKSLGKHKISQLEDLSDIGSLSDIDAIKFGELLMQQFQIIARDEMITLKETWKTLMGFPEAKEILKEDIMILQDILRGEKELNLKQLNIFIKRYDKFPLINSFKKLAKGKLNNDLDNLLKKIYFSKSDSKGNVIG